MARVLVPLPDRDFDVTEVAVPWHWLTTAGHQVDFATERGTVPAADPRLMTGVLFGQLGAEAEAKTFYRELEKHPDFRSPTRFEDIDPGQYDGLLLSGGHAPGMKPYLESSILRQKIAAFWALDRPVGAICHGTLLLARTPDPSTGKSVLATRRTTCLPQYMELTAWALTAWKLGSYYRTYPQTVEHEVRAALNDPAQQFVRGPIELIRKGTQQDHRHAFVCEDGHYISARWPGDAYLYAMKFARLLALNRPQKL